MDKTGPPAWLELTSYLLLALGAVLPALLTPGHIIGDGVDMFGTFWFYWWIQECLLEWQDPGFTKLFFFPLGKDIFAHTGNNFVDALAAQPFQWLLGYPRYQPVFVAFILLGNALSFRPLARHVLGRSAPGAGMTWAGWGATMLWMLAPYALFELMTGRLTQAFLWFVPLALYHFLRIGEGRWRHAPLCGLFTGLAGWTYWFNAHFLVIAMAWLAAVALIERRQPPLRLLGGWVAAGAACLLTVAPAALRMSALAAEGDVPGLSEAATGSIFEGPQGVANNVSNALHGYILMETEGQPMLGYLVWGGGILAFALLGRQRLRWLGFIAVMLLFSLGPSVPTDPELIMPHYMVAYYYLPYFDRLWFPYRMLGVVFVGVALGLGILIQRLGAARYPWALPVALVVLTAAEQNRNLAYPLVHRDLTPPQVYREIGRIGGALIEAPVGVSRVSIAFQPVHGQPVFGGMGENASVLWPDNYTRRLANTFIRYLRTLGMDPRREAEFRAGHLTNFVGEGFRWVVLDRQLVDGRMLQRFDGDVPPELLEAPFIMQRKMMEALGEPWAVEERLVVWNIGDPLPSPAGLEPTEENLWTRSWPREERPVYEAHLESLGRLGK